MSVLRSGGGIAVLVAGIVFLHAGAAAVFLFGDPRRTAGPSYTAARHVLPIQAWAFVFAAVALVLAVALACRKFKCVVAASVLGAGLCSWWAVLVAIAAHDHPQAGLLGVVLWLFAAISHVSVSIAASRLIGRGF